jgi:DNA helicase HerA-like ATPase
MAIIHTLYTGVTQSGKTTLARTIERELFSSGHRTIVYDPLGTSTAGGDWASDEVYDNLDEFIDIIYHPDTVDAHVFIDEAHNLLGHADKTHYWLLTEGRHHYLTLHLMTQRPNKLHPDVRTNCGQCMMFRLSSNDASLIGADFGFNGLDKIKLDTGDFLVLKSGQSEFSRANVFQLLEN